jgi:hypothetical protein
MMSEGSYHMQKTVISIADRFLRVITIIIREVAVKEKDDTQ